MKYLLAMLLGTALTAVTIFLFRWRGARRANRGDGCLACGSKHLERSGNRLTCLDCGYEGSVDRGGEIKREDLDFFDTNMNR